MITFEGVSKYYQTKLGKQYVFRDLSFSLPEGSNIAVLGSNGAGKSTLFKLIAGSEFADAGSISSSGSLSWPVSLSNGVHPKMTARENTRFIAKVHGVADLDEYEQRVKRFSKLGVKFDLPVGGYSSGMRARLAFACCICIPFDMYLVDEAFSVGDKRFQRRAQRALKRLKPGSLLMVSHNMAEVRAFCDSAVVLNDGQLTHYQDLEEAISVYQNL